MLRRRMLMKKKYVIHFQQLINNTMASYILNGVTFTKNANGSHTLVGTTTNANCFMNINYGGVRNSCGLVAGHQFLLSPNPQKISAKTDIRVGIFNDGGTPNVFFSASSYGYLDTDVNPFTVTTVGTQTWARYQVGFRVGISVNQTITPMLFDLTAMFVDAQEIMPTTYAEFREMFPNEFYAYTAQPYDVEIWR